jgi:hypothetical protein
MGAVSQPGTGLGAFITRISSSRAETAAKIHIAMSAAGSRANMNNTRKIAAIAALTMIATAQKQLLLLFTFSLLLMR